MTNPIQPVFHSLFNLHGDARCLTLEEHCYTTDHNGTHFTGRSVTEIKPSRLFSAATTAVNNIQTRALFHANRARGRFQVIIEDDARAVLSDEQVARIEKFEREADRKMEVA